MYLVDANEDPSPLNGGYQFSMTNGHERWRVQVSQEAIEDSFPGLEAASESKFWANRPLYADVASRLHAKRGGVNRVLEVKTADVAQHRRGGAD